MYLKIPSIQSLIIGYIINTQKFEKRGMALLLAVYTGYYIYYPLFLLRPQKGEKPMNLITCRFPR